jgi:hypothetical protein
LVDRGEDATIDDERGSRWEDETMVMSDVAQPELDAHPGPSPAPAPPSEQLEPGSRVEVRNRLDGRWTKGFEVLARDPGGYRLRRLSDGNELPLVFTDDDVRQEKRRSGMWWY